MYVFRNEGISCAEDRVVAIQTTACMDSIRTIQ